MALLKDDFRKLWFKAVAEPTSYAVNIESASYEIMRLWTEKLEGDFVQFEIKDNYATFLIDFSKIPIKDMGHNLVVLCHKPSNGEEVSRLTKFIDSYASELKASGSLCFLLFSDYDPISNISFPYFNSATPGVVMFGSDIESLLFSAIPQAILIEIIKERLPETNLCPFDSSKPARSAMFVGRQRELNLVRQKKYNKILLTGARRIGKSSLLEKAANLYKDGLFGKLRVFEFNCLNIHDKFGVHREIARECELDLHDIEKSGLNSILRSYSEIAKNTVIFLFDEFDGVAQNEQNTGWSLIKELEVAASNDYVRLLFAGFKEVPLLSHDNRSPFYERIKEITLDPLQLIDVEKLLIPPLKRFVEVNNKDEFIKIAYEKSGGFPFLLHFFGEKIFEEFIEKGISKIGPESIESVAEQKYTYDYLMNVFKWNTQSIDRCVAVLVAFYGNNEAMNVGDILKKSRELNLSLTDTEIFSSCNDLVSAYIFKWENKRYSFAFGLWEDIVRKTYSFDSLNDMDCGG